MTDWQHKIYLGEFFHNPDLTFIECRDGVVKAIRESTAWDSEDWRLEGLIEELSDAQNEEEFDFVWDEVYDWADDNRVWIDTFERAT